MDEDLLRVSRGLDDSSPIRRAEAARALGGVREEWAVRLLCRALDDYYASVRVAAAEALGGTRAPESVEALLAALGDVDWRVRGAAALSLGRIGGAAVVEALGRLLAEEDGYVRESAARGLADMGEGALAEAISAALSGDAEAPARLGDPRAERVLRAVSETARIEDRRAAIEALGWLGDAAAVPSLIRALADPEESIRETTIAALARVGAPAVQPLIQALCDPPDLAADGEVPPPEWESARALPRDPEALVAAGAATALGRIGDDRARRVLVAALAHPEDAVRSAAARSLGEMGDLGAAGALQEVLEQGAGEARREAASALGELRDPRSIGPLAAALADSDLGLSWRAAEALARFGEPAVAPVMQVLEHPLPHARAAAARALGKLGDPRAVDALIPCLVDLGLFVRQAAAEALEELGEGALAGALAPALEGEPEALAGCGDLRALPPLLSVLADPEHPLLPEAAAALGAWGAPAGGALERLQTLSRNCRNEDARRACRDAVRSIREALRRAPAELEHASAPAGRGTEPEAAAAPEGRGTEPEAAARERCNE